MSTAARLAAAKSNRVNARRRFNEAFDAAVARAIAAGHKTADSIDLFAEMDPAVIAAREASIESAAELRAAEAEATRADRLATEDAYIRASAAALPEGNPATMYDPRGGCEA